ncbi:MAG: MTAP family purine nucleoside phosphorylase [Candidatus Thalassarchaeum sp.]
MARIAVLCGTGMSAFASHLSSATAAKSSTLRIDSEWGQVPATLIDTGDGEVMVIDRHHSNSNSRTPPHRIEHRANVHAAASFQPNLILSINSVGSMRQNLPPGIIGVAADVLDLAEKPWTFHDEHATHADRTSCFNPHASEICSKTLQSTQGQVADDLVVAQCIGPQFETPSEIDALERLGADVVGMTLGPESRLIAETGIAHAALSCSSNWAAGRTPGSPEAEIDHEAVDEMAASMRESVGECVKALLSSR